MRKDERTLEERLLDEIEVCLGNPPQVGRLSLEKLCEIIDLLRRIRAGEFRTENNKSALPSFREAQSTTIL